MISLNVVDEDTDHFIVSADEPVRIEVSVVSGRVIAHAYRGHMIDMEQEPDLVYDGNDGGS